MFLEKLTVTSNDGLIRDIAFHPRGLNLIIDLTKDKSDRRSSGNNVGKTTFIRSIDYCFGASGNDLFQDKELKNDNELIKKFLFEKAVTFTLSLRTLNDDKIIIQRSFSKEKDLYINGVQSRNLTSYRSELNKIIFGINDDESPISFRNIIKKFVRSDEESANNILRILHSVTKASLYRAMYLTLFGFKDHNLLKNQSELTNRLDELNKKVKVVKGIHSLDQLKQKLTILKQQVGEKEQQVKTFQLPVTYDKLIKQLNTLKDITSTLSSEVSALTTKITFNKKTRDELSHSQVRIDPIAIKQLYQEAQKLLPDIQRQFEDVLDFHQKMIANKVRFIDQHIVKLEKEKEDKKIILNKYLEEQSTILQLLENTGTFDDLIKVRNDLNDILVQQGKVLSQIEQIEDLQRQIKETSEELEVFKIQFANHKQEIKSNTDVFNNYLIHYSEAAHGEQLYIYYDSEKDMFDLSNLQGNAGKGYKKSDIIAFDLAYISFANELGLQCPRFVIHDELEIVHPNQIETIFEIAESINGQLFISVLKDKIEFLGNDFIEKHRILTLSQDDKFFRT